jgi:ABC-3C protein
MDSFISASDASASQLGGQYQLLLALRSFISPALEDPSIALIYERLDDVAMVKGDELLDSIQAKHHEECATLSDYSPEWWRTAHAWIPLYNSNLTTLTTRFTLSTTNLITSTAGLGYLTDSNRDVGEARRLLENAALQCRNKECLPGIAAFSALSPTERLAFLEACYVLPGSPTTESLTNDLRRILLHAVRPDRVNPMYQRLLGWWSSRVQHHLENRPTDRITGLEFQQTYYDLIGQFRDDNLPIDEEIAALNTDTFDHEGRIFVRQLELIAAKAPVLRQAIRDYYRAYTQRVRWISDDLLYAGELKQYERRIKDEWDTHFTAYLDELADGSSEDSRQFHGRSFYRTFVIGRNEYIRPLCSEGFIYRGTCHILSDDVLIGWHPNFVDRLRSLLHQTN